MFTVLGGQGFIGTNLVRSLRKQGHEVYAPTRGRLKETKNSLGNVIYAIGITSDFRSRPFDTVHAHVSFVSEVLENYKFDSFLYLSSTRIYSGANSAKEDATLRVSSNSASDLYNLSKLMGESICLNCGRERVRVARLSNVVGVESGNKDSFIALLARDAIMGKIVLETALPSAKDYIAIDDVVDILPKISLGGRRSVYNVASGGQITHQEWLNYFKKRTSCNYEVVHDAQKVSFLPIKIDRIVKEFGFSPRSIFDFMDRNWNI